MSKIACPCCGYLVFDERGCYEICPVCFWEDDGVQIADPWFSGGANEPSLEQSQRNFAQSQAGVRAATKGYTKDPDWRPVRKGDRKHVTTPGEIDEKNKTGEAIPYEYWERNPSN